MIIGPTANTVEGLAGFGDDGLEGFGDDVGFGSFWSKIKGAAKSVGSTVAKTAGSAIAETGRATAASYGISLPGGKKKESSSPVSAATGFFSKLSMPAKVGIVGGGALVLVMLLRERRSA